MRRKFPLPARPPDDVPTVYVAGTVAYGLELAGAGRRSRQLPVFACDDRDALVYFSVSVDVRIFPLYLDGGPGLAICRPKG